MVDTPHNSVGRAKSCKRLVSDGHLIIGYQGPSDIHGIVKKARFQTMRFYQRSSLSEAVRQAVKKRNFKNIFVFNNIRVKHPM